MHLALVAATIIIAWKRADWKNWQKYHPTMLYVAIGNLLYIFLYYDHYLWQFHGVTIINATTIEMLMTFIILPFTALIYLSNYPVTLKGQIIHNIKYVAVYIALEWIYLELGLFKHSFGWNMWCSLVWDIMMFPMWVLHHKRPLIAYLASFIAVIIMLMLFPVNLT